jgi:GT2 family glycosyltransferase
MEPSVSVIIVNWNGLMDTIECVNSLTQIEYLNYSLIIVDNGSSENDAEKLKERFQNIKVLKLKRNLGFAIANNLGIRKGLKEGADYVLLLNNDTIVDRQFLNNMIQVAEEDNNIGILGPKIYSYDNKDKLHYAGGKFRMYINHSTEGQHKRDIGQYEKLKETDWISGACMLIRKSVLEKVGLLPEEYFLSWEDIDLCLAAKREGYSCVFVPRSHIWHKVSSSFKREKLEYEQVFFGFRNRIIIRYKYLTKSKFMLFIGIQIFAVLPIHMIYYVFVYKDLKRIRYLWKGVMSGIKDMRMRKAVYKPA